MFSSAMSLGLFLYLYSYLQSRWNWFFCRWAGYSSCNLLKSSLLRHDTHCSELPAYRCAMWWILANVHTHTHNDHKLRHFRILSSPPRAPLALHTPPAYPKNTPRSPCLDFSPEGHISRKQNAQVGWEPFHSDQELWELLLPIFHCVNMSWTCDRRPNIHQQYGFVFFQFEGVVNEAAVKWPQIHLLGNVCLEFS